MLNEGARINIICIERARREAEAAAGLEADFKKYVKTLSAEDLDELQEDLEKARKRRRKARRQQ